MVTVFAAVQRLTDKQLRSSPELLVLHNDFDPLIDRTLKSRQEALRASLDKSSKLKMQETRRGSISFLEISAQAKAEVVPPTLPPRALAFRAYDDLSVVNCVDVQELPPKEFDPTGEETDADFTSHSVLVFPVVHADEVRVPLALAVEASRSYLLSKRPARTCYGSVPFLLAIEAPHPTPTYYGSVPFLLATHATPSIPYELSIPPFPALLSPRSPLTPLSSHPALLSPRY